MKSLVIQSISTLACLLLNDYTVTTQYINLLHNLVDREVMNTLLAVQFLPAEERNEKHKDLISLHPTTRVTVQSPSPLLFGCSRSDQPNQLLCSIIIGKS